MVLNVRVLLVIDIKNYKFLCNKSNVHLKIASIRERNEFHLIDGLAEIFATVDEGCNPPQKFSYLQKRNASEQFATFLLFFPLPRSIWYFPSWQAVLSIR